MLFDQLKIKYKLTAHKNLQGDAILKCLHGVLGNVFHAAGQGNKDDLDLTIIKKSIIDS